MKQIAAGVTIGLWHQKKNYIRCNIGYIYALINDSYHQVDSKSDAFRFGLTAERNVFGNTRVILGVSYDYQKTEIASFRDFDMLKLSLGYIL